MGTRHLVVVVVAVLLAACSSGGGAASRTTHAPTTATIITTTTTLPLPRPAPPDTPAVSADVLVLGDVAVDLSAKDFGLTLSADARQCAADSWADHTTPAERDAIDLHEPNPVRDTNSDASHAHLAAAFAACLSGTDLFAATDASLSIHGEGAIARCEATGLQQAHLAPAAYWTLLIMGPAKAPLAAQTAVQAARRAC